MRSIVSIFSLVLLPLYSGKNNDVLEVPVMEMLGVDVSHHQKAIDWQRVAEQQSINFAFVKATEGGDFIDTLFCKNWEDLRKHGIRRGAYHFFRAYGCGYEQALHFLKTVEFAPGDLAPVLDVETSDNMSPEILQQEAAVWLNTVEQHLGIRPILYSNQHFYDRYLAGAFDDYPLWVARYSEEKPWLQSGKRWDIWQYANDGCIDGISRRVDMNIFYGTQAMLDRLCWFPAQNASTLCPAEASVAP